MRTIWVRHGQSEYNEQNLATGWHDPELTKLGIQQALDTAIQLGNRFVHIDSIHTSDLRRAFNTAQVILKTCPWFVDIKVDSKLRERDYGDWAGKNKDQNLADVGEEMFFEMRRGWDMPPPGGESLKDTAMRVADYLDNIEVSNLPQIFVCHGNTIRAASVVLGKNSEQSVRDWEIETGGFVVWDS